MVSDEWCVMCDRGGCGSFPGGLDERLAGAVG